MVHQKALIVRPGTWSEEAGALLAQSSHDPLVGVGTMRAVVTSGRASLFEILDGSDLAGAYILQPVQCEHGAELVVIAAGGVPGYRLTPSVVPYIEQQAAQFDRVRINASRPGMARQLRAMGYSRQAEIFVKALHVL